eukprot:scaffold109993_cov39-Prasinocladus_malaysianus.AAC.1
MPMSVVGQPAGRCGRPGLPPAGRKSSSVGKQEGHDGPQPADGPVQSVHRVDEKAAAAAEGRDTAANQAADAPRQVARMEAPAAGDREEAAVTLPVVPWMLHPAAPADQEGPSANIPPHAAVAAGQGQSAVCVAAGEGIPVCQLAAQAGFAVHVHKAAAVALADGVLLKAAAVVEVAGLAAVSPSWPKLIHPGGVGRPQLVSCLS